MPFLHPYPLFATAPAHTLDLTVTLDQLLRNYYGPDNPIKARMKMAYVPEVAKLISNPVSWLLTSYQIAYARFCHSLSYFTARATKGRAF